MDAGVSIRPAEARDAGAISAVLTASIRQLCGADHRGDPDRLRAWLANKTPQRVRAWIEGGGVRLLLAEVGGAPAAVGGWRRVDALGEIVLLYVAPAARLRGASAALLARMEAEMAAAGLARARLETTATARPFYAARGWRPDVPRGRLLLKRLAPG